MKTPDFIEPFVGWKGLLADDQGRLFSPIDHEEWPAGEPMVADRVPEARNSNGIYAVKTYESLKENQYHWQNEPNGKVWVLAELNLWGSIRRGQIGYCAEFAYPRKIWVSPRQNKIGRLIRGRYDVPLGLIDRFTGRRI